ncbi:RNA polymerase recycling motor ATPase HelR [Dietzia maris]|uniref:RNA polymerase recycling motor ATPase HelR n=1 Tax=Dietzia maris TaxID=37915 RepID=UPI0022287DB4|nr:RNA polymerase recycling motor ATPase HelR [Dietzia maris]MCT1433988.1 AAA family ATPase [Dietzia maris]MCT1521116.1 AAA family ATPase [Dietzia maris]
MSPEAPGIFALPGHLAHKADPAHIDDDERHLAAISHALDQKVAVLSARLDARRRDPAGRGAQTIERDADIRRLVAELATLRRFGLDVCIGHYAVAMSDPAAPDSHHPDHHQTGSAPVYVGRIGLTDAAGTPLLVDWRAPAAEPFFAATLADPRGVTYRRRYRWSGGHIVDYWDEVFGDDDEVSAHVSPDDLSAFVSSLSEARTGRMRDVLTTIQADQDAIIRADSRGALIVDGGPGTGKTVVALHRAAYLLHAQSREGLRRGNLLLVGPHRPYLDYVADVLPSLGEHSVQTATVADLGLTALGGAIASSTDGLPYEPHPEAARLKSELRMVEAIEAAVHFYEQPPEQSMLVQTEWVDLRLTPADWAEAFGSVEDGTPHNEAHPQIRETLTEILVDRALHNSAGGGVPAEVLRAELAAHPDLHRALYRAWPMIGATDLVGDLWTVPAYLRLCAPCLATDQLQLLQRPAADSWTTADLPLLDAAHHRLGDADRARRAQRRRVERSAELARRQRVIDDLIAADDDPEGVSPMLRHGDLQEALLDTSAEEDPAIGDARLSGVFGHIIVDEAQELTDAEWRMILRRCPSRSLTVVGDRAQSRRDFDESWPERLERIGLSPARITSVHLSINYRTPAEIMEAAAPVIRSVRPDANVPESVRRSGLPVQYGRIGDLQRVVDGWLATHSEGMVGVICATGATVPDFNESDRVRSLTPAQAKGLEFDLVVLVDPETFGSGVTGAVDRYVAMTRATQHLAVLRS